MRNYPGYAEIWNSGPNTGPDEKFMPTYKQDSKNVGEYIDKKDQCPSYTDRILMKNNSTCKLVNTSYMPLHHVKGSDH